VSRDDLYEHLGYWQDEVKVNAYRAALHEVVSKGDRVLDLGSGTGLLGMLAAQAGADKVWCYDDGPILGLARALAEQHGIADRMEFVNELTTDASLPEVDVIVCDQIGGLVHDAGVLEYFADAQRALRAGGTLVPSAFEIFMAPVHAVEPYRQVEGWGQLAGFDTAPARTAAANTEWRVGPGDITLLSRPHSIDRRSSDDASPMQAEALFQVDTAGVLHGLSGWFVAQMSPSVTITNSPIADERMNRWLNFYPLASPVKVEPGQQLRTTFSVHPVSQLVSWSIAVDQEQPQRMSTFNGALMFDVRTDLGADREIVNPDQKAMAANELIALAAGGASTAEMAAAAERFPSLLPTPGAARRFACRVRSLLED